MANFHNHPRIRRRNYEYPRLMPSDIKMYMSPPNGYRHSLSWSINDQLVLELDGTNTPYGLDLKSSNGLQQLIPTAWTKLKNGSRQWWVCPKCCRRCGVLYFSRGFACRHCVQPAYDCQNGARGDYLARKIRDLRSKVFGCSEGCEDVLETMCSIDTPSSLSDIQYRVICQKIAKLQIELGSTFKF